MEISKNKSRIIKIVGVVLFVLLIIALAALAIYLPKEAVKDKENDAVPSYSEKEIDSDKDETESEGPKEDSKTIEENKTEEKKEDAKANNNADQNNKKETKPSSNLNTGSNSGSSSSSGSSSGSGSTSSPKPTYSCPDGYKMSNKKCIKTINAEYVCPSGMHESDNNMCISFSEGHEANEEHDCPSGETMIKTLGFMGTPEKYNCYPLHKKVYSCPSDYVLNGTVCTKTIDATKK